MIGGPAIRLTAGSRSLDARTVPDGPMSLGCADPYAGRWSILHPNGRR